MRINGQKINFFREILVPAAKNMFNFKAIKLERQPAKDIYINTIPYVDGIKSKTFKILSNPQYIPTNRIDESGARITTLIDKKTNTPVEAFVAMISDDDKSLERYIIMVKDSNGDIDINGQKFTKVGGTHFYINNDAQMITPKFGAVFADNEFGEKELFEKVDSYMKSNGNDKYGGIGTRLHQMRVERMLMNNFGNVCIAAEGNSFPFHYNMGYRLEPKYEEMDNLVGVVKTLCGFNKKSPEDNFKFVSVEEKDGKQVINLSHSIENCLCDYYNNGGKPLVNFMPNMYLTETSADQWIEFIKKQPILL